MQFEWVPWMSLFLCIKLSYDHFINCNASNLGPRGDVGLATSVPTVMTCPPRAAPVVGRVTPT